MNRPAVVFLLDALIDQENSELGMAEIVIGEKSSIVGKTLKQIGITEKTEIVVLIIKKQGRNNIVFKPCNDEILNAGDNIVILGKEVCLNQFREMADEA
ncbi:MAG: TrkA C-terminal domain-containing protein [Clostridiaceae bacterium]|nr:TrkA C-terminal domain-containing protein [Clostridiaceae bacterium]